MMKTNPWGGLRAKVLASYDSFVVVTLPVILSLGFSSISFMVLCHGSTQKSLRMLWRPNKELPHTIYAPDYDHFCNLFHNLSLQDIPKCDPIFDLDAADAQTAGELD
jgi:hypothetical protein